MLSTRKLKFVVSEANEINAYLLKKPSAVKCEWFIGNAAVTPTTTENLPEEEEEEFNLRLLLCAETVANG